MSTSVVMTASSANVPARRTPWLAVTLPAVALVGAGARWLVQGGGAVWTDADRRLYVPDPDLGWRLGKQGLPWLGLDALAVIAGFLLAASAGAWWLSRRERRLRAPSPALRRVLWTLASLPLLIPLWAFVLGNKPAGARARLPQEAALALPVGVAPDARLAALPAGVYAVRAHPGTSLVAAVTAGGETFDARFAGLEGSWRGDPADLSQPMTATVRTRAATVDTGVDMRSKHAREILASDAHPELVFTLTRVTGARLAAAGIEYTAEGNVTMMGATFAVAASGTLRAPDAEARTRLAIDDAQALLATARFVVDLRTTALAKSAKDFDQPTIAITVSLVLTPYKETRP